MSALCHTAWNSCNKWCHSVLRAPCCRANRTEMPELPVVMVTPALIFWGKGERKGVLKPGRGSVGQ